MVSACGSFTGYSQWLQLSNRVREEGDVLLDFPSGFVFPCCLSEQKPRHLEEKKPQLTVFVGSFLLSLPVLLST